MGLMRWVLALALVAGGVLFWLGCECDEEEGGRTDEEDDTNDDINDDDDDDDCGWAIMTIDSESAAGLTVPCTAIDSSDNVHIGYSMTINPDLKYATNKTGGWQTFTINSNEYAFQNLSLAIDSSDKEYISYADEGPLYCVTNKTGSWQTFIIAEDADGTSLLSLAIDSSDKLHVSYVGKIDSPYHSYLQYATNESDSWQTFIIDFLEIESWHITSIAIDSFDNVHISYTNKTTAPDDIALKYATNKTGSWQTFTIDSDGKLSGYSTSIAIDSSDNVHISYLYCITDFDGYHKYVTNKTGSWQTCTIDSAHFETAGGANSIAIDSDDYVHISYYDAENELLKYATNRPPE